MPAKKAKADEHGEETRYGSAGGGTHTKPVSAVSGITVMAVSQTSARAGSASPGAV